ncbi:MAG: hypothetical protein CMM07_18580 [Rhodopirellula sp.]|nr:hypothetical protein [Rhodopirellula sp.]
MHIYFRKVNHFGVGHKKFQDRRNLRPHFKTLLRYVQTIVSYLWALDTSLNKAANCKLRLLPATPKPV